MMKQQLETQRLLLRAWTENDADELYSLAGNPLIGEMAGWPAHRSTEESREIIRTVFAFPNVFAITLKTTGQLIGCIGIQTECNIPLPADEAEIGYWLGTAYWGKGYMPEAMQALVQYAFRKLQLKRLWCGCYESNTQSARVQEKCGFRYHHTTHNTPTYSGDCRTEIWRCIDAKQISEI